MVTNVRHKAALERACNGLGAGVTAIHKDLPPELVTVDLEEAKDGLEEIIGVVNSEDIIKHIFSKFCIGK